MYKYMIHTCPQRKDYVKEYLIPSLIVQGIDINDIILWLDEEKEGNLKACMKAFASLPEQGSTWHLQDDVVVCRDFKLKAEFYGGEALVVCGYCCSTYSTANPGKVAPAQMWYSFPCIKIDNKIAKECAEWYYNQIKGSNKFRKYVAAGKFDDTIFLEFLKEKYGNQKICLNLKPNLVDHVDYLIGGSIVNKDRWDKKTPAAYLEDVGIAEKLRKKMELREKEKDMRVAAFCGTRNLYDDMVPAVKSLLVNSNVERIYLIIEDDEFPHELPPQVQCINVSNQKFFRADGPNMNSRFTYMAMMRAALCYLLPQHDKVLSLDIDTIVVQDISELWDINLGSKYFAACVEPDRCVGGRYYKKGDPRRYYNIGVVMYNLKELRDRKAAQIIHALNEKEYPFVEQDAMNEFCDGWTMSISSDYNCMKYGVEYCGRSFDPKIIHFAAVPNWNKRQDITELNMFRNMKIGNGEFEF